MAEMHRCSSHRQRLDHVFLANRLKGAKSYKRIAGYFRSSIFELVGEEIADILPVQIVCNSELDAADVVVSKHVRETALKARWNAAPAEVEALLHREHYRDSEERRGLLERKFGTVVLDEAHRARRRGGLGEKQGEPNNLLDFMPRIGPRTKHLLLGTATPMQTEVSEL
jgi:hypothetical protein